MSKNLVFMRDIVCKYHPAFKRSADLRETGIKHCDIFNIERLIEQTLAAVGRYKFVDEEGYDFTDYSDSKTTSINANTRVATINSVENKVGALRIIAYNPFKNSADYFFVSKNSLFQIKKPCYGVNSYKERIKFTYAQDNDHYGQFEKYRVTNFKEVACAKG